MILSLAYGYFDACVTDFPVFTDAVLD